MGCNSGAWWSPGSPLEFQYPLRVEVGCKQLSPSVIHSNRVSVPSTGRSGLQVQFSTKYEPRFKFQCPLRVEVGCNILLGRHQGSSYQFQYPLRVEVGCNELCHITAQFCSMFQYPLRVEVGCKLSTWTGASRGSGFSTLYGSKWVATWLYMEGAGLMPVSVPSTGRSGLQLLSRTFV